ncbi:NIPSNAP family protein [Granulicella tundricola]|nr:NIPSNAP family protein [Granulicella tundricola]
MATITMLKGTAMSEVTSETVYELRIYHLNEGKLPLILNRFRTKEVAIFKRLGMEEVGYWTPTDEPLANRTLIYMLKHKSRAAATESWAKFKVDPEWVALKAETEKDGTFVIKNESTFMKLTDFSPKV